MPILRNFLLFTLPLASRVAFHSINNSVKTKNFCGNFPEDTENVEFPKIGAFKISGNSGRKVRYKGNSRQEMSENLGQFSFPNILKNVVLFVTGNFLPPPGISIMVRPLSELQKRVWKTEQPWILARLFAYQDSRFLTLFIEFMFYGVTVTKQVSRKTIVVPIQNSRNWYS